MDEREFQNPGSIVIIQKRRYRESLKPVDSALRKPVVHQQFLPVLHFVAEYFEDAFRRRLPDEGIDSISDHTDRFDLVIGAIFFDS